jgi:hypothetical protein
MDITEVSKYNHKITKIQITNNNISSYYNYLIAKITLNNVPSYYTIRFSYSQYGDFIPHQQINNDFFMQIPNDLNTISYIYAHYFFKDLYQYDEDTIVHANLDLSKIQTDGTISNSNNYSTKINNGNLQINYLLSNSTSTNIRDPNWKNIVLGYSEGNVGNMTEKGHYPLDSKFRDTYHYFDEPKLTDIDNQLRWKETSTTNNAKWNAKISADKISSYITDKNDPLNIYMQYRYLPSSSEYHEHYIGISGLNDANSDPLLLQGDNLNLVNNYLGTNTHRLIRRGYPSDVSNSFTITKGIDIGFIFDPIPYTTNNEEHCKINKDSCGNYYKINNNGYNEDDKKCYQSIPSLDTDSHYTLKYFIYIPKKTQDSKYYYLEIDGEKPDDRFLEIDVNNTKEWNYHEINFQPSKETVLLNFNGCYQEDLENPIFLYNVELTKDPLYNPLIKYNKMGMIVQEEDKYSSMTYPTADTEESYALADNQYKQTITLPEPFIDVYMIPYLGGILTNFIGKQKEAPLATQVVNTGSGVYCTNDECIYVYNNSWNKSAVMFSKSPNNIAIQTFNLYNNIITDGTIKLSIQNKAGTVLKDCGTSNINSDGLSSFYINFGNFNTDTDYYLNIEYSDSKCTNRNFTNRVLCQVIAPNIGLSALLKDIDSNGVEHVLRDNSLTTWSGIDKSIIPFTVEVDVTNTITSGTAVNNGNISLYVDDVLNQTSLVKNGVAQLYIDTDDINASGNYVLKIEYRDDDNTYPTTTMYKMLEIE